MSKVSAHVTYIHQSQPSSHLLRINLSTSNSDNHLIWCNSTLTPLRERNVLFNDVLNTFYLRLYGVRHMVKDHSDSEKGNPLPPHRLLLSINSKGSFICTITLRITHTTAFVTPVVEHWLEREIAVGPPHEGTIRRPTAP